jgi:hypothetical protein
VGYIVLLRAVFMYSILILLIVFVVVVDFMAVTAVVVFV